MSYWRALCDASGAKHVLPCTRRGRPLGDHVMAGNCRCAPELDREPCVGCGEAHWIWIHNDAARGGSLHGECH